LLGQYGMVIEVAVGGGHSNDEISAYQAYVSGGGSLLLLTDWGGSDLPRLAFGLDFEGETDSTIVNQFVSHPITRGVSALPYMVGSVLMSYPSGATILGWLSSGAPVLGCMTYGAGKIVFIGDTNGVETVPQPFTDNYLGWLGVSSGKKILVDASDDGGVWWYPQAGTFDSNLPHQGKALADYIRSLGCTVTELPTGSGLAYDVTINAHCNSEGIDVSVPITEDGSSTSFKTPYTFSRLMVTHTFSVPSTDPSGHPFTQWSTGETTTTITVSSGGSYTAYYQAVQRKLTVSSVHGSPSPAVGDHLYDDGSSVTCSVSSPVTEGGTTYVCTGWTGSGSVQSSGTSTTVTFAITQDSSITWNWKASPPSTYSVFFEESGVGNPAQVWSVTLDGYGTEYSNGPSNTIHTIIFTGVANGGPYQFTVTPPSGFVAQPSQGPITVNGGDFHQPLTFNPVPVTYTFTLTAGSGGSVSYSFSLGSGTVLSGQSQQLTVPQSCQISMTANPDSLHVFQNWSPTDSVSVSDPSSASTTATVNGNGGVTANFAYNLGVSISPTSASIQTGQTVSFTATPSGGSGGYTYMWYWMEYGTANHDSYNSGSSSTYTFARSEAGNYGVYVVVTDSSGYTGQSLSSSVTVQPTPAPKNLEAQPSYSSIILTWSEPDNPHPSVLDYCIYRGTSANGESSIVYSKVDGNTKNFEDKSVTTGTIYYYYARAEYAVGLSGCSNEVRSASLESVKGVMSEVDFLTISKFQDVFPQCFSIQQNIMIPIRGDLGGINPPLLTLSEYYWVQNIIYVFGAGTIETWKMAGSMQIWHFGGGQEPYLVDCCDRDLLWDLPLFPKRDCIPRGCQYSDTVLLKTWIDGNTLKMTNNAIEDYEFTFPLNTFAYLPCSKESFIAVGGPAGLGVQGNSPEIVLVGSGTGFALTVPMYSSVAFKGTMEGLEESCFVIGGSMIAAQNWAVPNSKSGPPASTAETSTGLAWDKATGRFHYDSSSADEGFWFEPDFIGSPPSFATQISAKVLKSIVVRLQCPANLSVLDSQGNFAGFNQTSGQIQSEIPFAYFLDNNTLWILDPGETYGVKVSGQGNGDFTLLIWLTDENGQTSVLWNKTETITQNECLSWVLSPSTGGVYVALPQRSITFVQTGLCSDFTGTVITIDGTNYTASDLPALFSWDNGSTHTFAFQSPLLVGSGAKEYDWASTTGLSTLQSDSITVSGAGNVTGNYVASVTYVHDVAVTNVTVPFSSAYQGWVVNITVTVANLGNATENFTTTLDYDGNTIGVQPVLNLAPNATLTLLFSWNTTHVPYSYAQNYTVTAIASTVPGETNTSNNQLSGGQIQIRMMGDANGDGLVNMKDVALSIAAFNSWPGRPRWTYLCDLDLNGLVNMRDIVMIVMNFKHS